MASIISETEFIGDGVTYIVTVFDNGDEIITEKKTQKSFELNEIVFSEKNNEDFLKKYDKIIIDIENFGFEKAAAIHSISNTAKTGGNVGWVNQSQLSEKINLFTNYPMGPLPTCTNL